MDAKYKKFKEARKLVLNELYFNLTKKKIKNIKKLKDKEILALFKPFELKIVKEIKRRAKHYKGKFFNINMILENKIINEYFPIRMLNSIRNIGKTYDMERRAEKEVENGKNFIWMRLRKTDTDNYFLSEQNGLLNNNNWKYLSSRNIIIKEQTKEIIGYALALSTLMGVKSNSFPLVNKVFFDEFSIDGIKISNKWRILASFLTTIDRKDNPVFITMAANYVDPYDEFLAATGLDQKDIEGDFREQEFVFNWISGAILWNIQDGFFKEKKTSWLSIGKRSSLVSFETYKTQYQANFNRKYKYNIANSDIFEDIEEELLIIVCNEIYYTIAKLNNNQYLAWETEQEFLNNKIKRYGILENDCVFDLKAKLIETQQLKVIRELILEQKLWFTNTNDYNFFVDNTDIGKLEYNMFEEIKEITK